MSVFEDLTWRGMVHQVTDPELAKLLDHDTFTAYCGFDPTADSLHVGHLVQVLNLRRLQDGGHRIVALVGGGTGMIGDPSGRTSERTLLGVEQLDANVDAIRRQLSRYVDLSSPERGVLLDNGEWLRSMRLTEFLRDVGKHFTVNQMLAKESVKSRLQQRDHGISFTEFSYMLLQAYDFVELFDREGCRLQIGGSDQWGNITEGIDLIRRLRGAQAYGFTAPLLTKADGSKFGKSESGAVWLDPARTSPYEFHQYWIRSDDREVGYLLRALTFLPRERIVELEEATAAHPERREGQRALAFEVTKFVHGEEAAREAERTAQELFSGGGSVTATDDVTTDIGGQSIALVDALVASGLCSSRSDARRAVEQGGAYVDGEQVRDLDFVITAASATDGLVRLRRGKKQQRLLRFA